MEESDVSATRNILTFRNARRDFDRQRTSRRNKVENRKERKNMEESEAPFPPHDVNLKSTIGALMSPGRHDDCRSPTGLKCSAKKLHETGGCPSKRWEFSIKRELRLTD